MAQAWQIDTVATTLRFWTPAEAYEQARRLCEAHVQFRIHCYTLPGETDAQKIEGLPREKDRWQTESERLERKVRRLTKKGKARKSASQLKGGAEKIRGKNRRIRLSG